MLVGSARLILFELTPDVGEGEQVSVDHEFKVPGIFRNADDRINSMALTPKLLDEQVYVEHGQ